MRLSELTGKEVINIGDGARLGYIDECELVFDERSGKINALLLPKRGWLPAFLGDGKLSTIPWQSIRRIGDEVIIVDLNNAYERMYSLYNPGSEN
ncbi:MAG TPA: YlmC/YmxH family sporulation protein [Selenomonadales bacterium]|nr:YlmC/YmxH family sporulation protein [Selenomonadales bacterium]